MRRLREQEPMIMGDEEHHNLFDGLQDIRYARDFLNVVGEEEWGRFDERSWGYGDPTYLGGDLLEVFDSLLKSVVHTLFGAHAENDTGDEDVGDALEVAFYHAAVALEEDEILSDLVAADGAGGPVGADTKARVSPTTMAEHLVPPRTGHRHDYPGLGVAKVGTGAMNCMGYRVASEPTGDFEDVISIEISGSAEAVEGLSRYLRAGAGEGEAPRLYRWKAGSSTDRALREGPRPRDAVILLVGFEYFDLRSMIHDVVFARLLAAWREIKLEPTPTRPPVPTQE